MIETDLELVMVILFAVQITHGDDPARVGIDAEWQLIFVRLLIAGRGHDGQRDDPVGDEGVVGVVSVVGLNPDDAVADGHVFDDGFLEKGRVETRGVVVDIAHVDKQLGRV